MNLIKRVIVFILKMTLYVLDKDHRKEEHISDDIKKFTHVGNVNYRSDFGNITKIVRTVPYDMWEIKTVTKTLKCADKHKLFYKDTDGKIVEIYAMDLTVGCLLETDNGLEPVVSIRDLKCKVHCYCVEVDDPQHRYYANGIMSHNTTCAAAYILWFTTFRSTKTVLIAANKLAQAVEILDRIKFSYELLPKWLKAGTLKFNERMIKFDNKSRIICRATTKDSGRGLSIALLYVDEFGIIAPNLSREFYTAIKPTLATGGKMIITSTPMSDEDQFADIWFGSQNRFDDQGEKIPNGEGRNGFYGMKYIWSDHPDRDEKWAKEWRSSMDIRKFRQEFECCVENTIIQIERKTGENSQISMGDLFNLLK